MAHKFYPLTIKEIVKTTPECSLITFDIKDEWKPVFQYKQGQHLTLRAQLNGEEVRRSYSLCACPFDDEWRVAVKHVPGGLFSTYANEQLQPGDTVEAMPPNGRFFVEISKDRPRNYVAFAAGSGITPVFSLLKTHLTAEPQSTFQLFYINKTTDSIILKEEIEGLKNKFMDRLEVYHFLTRQERDVVFYNGRIDKEKLDIIFKNIVDKEAIDNYFLCGPGEMIFFIKDYLNQIGTDKEKIHFELFGVPGASSGQVEKPRTVEEGKMCSITIHEGGKTFTFKATQAAASILDAALQNNADLPFACKGGVCATCRAKLLEGQVEMKTNYALEQDEVNDGFILTCQAVPLTDRVVVDYDR